jgi:methylase of polypeptide subunit release factors
MSASPQIAPLPPYRRLLGRAMAFGYRLIGRDRYDDYRLERIQDVPLIVMPTVFNPKVPRTGAFLASQIHAPLIGKEAEVLDLGTGSGVCALFAARHARRVVAVDINPAAIRCAGINIQLNRLEHKVELRQGDLFAPVAQERFDVVLFNPPFLLGPPSDDRDRAWRSPDIAARFAAELGAHLKPGGFGLLLLSTFGDAAVFLWELRMRNVEISVLAERRFVNERLTIFRLTPSSSDATDPRPA